MKVVFCWSNISGYMAACWRELSLNPGVDLHVLAYGDSKESGFGAGLMKDVSWRSLDTAEREDGELIKREVLGQQPDIVIIAGWLSPAYVKLVSDPDFDGVRFVMGMDTPWRATLRQHLAGFALRRLLEGLSAIFVPGERAWQFATRLGFPATRIHRGMYGVDWEGFGVAHRQRGGGPWPRAFLFAGRYEEEKGVDLLVAAYRKYRSDAANPWRLNVCGMGSLKHRFEGIDGLVDHGFLQPSETLDLMADSGALVLPSRYDPWPLIVVEAAAAGLPLLVSDACGSTVELLRSQFNGLTFSAGTDPGQLAKAMARISSCEEISAWGDRSRLLAEAYGARFWCQRWLAVLESLLQRSSA